MVEKLCCPWGSNPRLCAPSLATLDLWLHLQSNSSSLRSSGFRLACALVKWLFGRGTLRQSPFLMAGSQTQPLKGITIQTTPTPLLGLQHAANMPGLSNLSFIITLRFLGSFFWGLGLPYVDFIDWIDPKCDIWIPFLSYKYTIRVILATPVP